MKPNPGPQPAPQGARPTVPSFEVLVAQTSDDLYRLATRLTGERAEAQDVLQTAYLRAFEGLRAGAFRGECRLETWLYRIVTNTAFDARRASRYRERIVAESSPVAQTADRSEAAVSLRELRESLEQLPTDQRAALVLKELHGLSGRETAEVLERSEGAVEQLLVRARATLKKRFES
jgi:RNA polymerase sigma-70 factor (ECF subfamily)